MIFRKQNDISVIFDISTATGFLIFSPGGEDGTPEAVLAGKQFGDSSASHEDVPMAASDAVVPGDWTVEECFEE